MRPEGTPATVLGTLNQICAARDTCQVLHTPHFRFRVSLPEDELQFNTEVAMGFVWLETNPVLHVIDTHTCSQNTAFIKDTTAARLWRLFVEEWASVYCGYRDVLRVDGQPFVVAAALR